MKRRQILKDYAEIIDQVLENNTSHDIIRNKDVILGLYQWTTNIEDLKWDMRRHYELISFYKYDIIRYSITGKSELGQISVDRKRIPTLTIRKAKPTVFSASEMTTSFQSDSKDVDNNTDTDDSKEVSSRTRCLEQVDEEWLCEDRGETGLQNQNRYNSASSDRCPPSTVAVLGLIQVDDLLGII